MLWLCTWLRPDLPRKRRPALPVACAKGNFELKKYSRQNYDSILMAQGQQAKRDNSINESLFTDEKLKTNNKNNSALGRKVICTRQSQATIRHPYCCPFSAISSIVFNLAALLASSNSSSLMSPCSCSPF